MDKFTKQTIMALVFKYLGYELLTEFEGDYIKEPIAKMAVEKPSPQVVAIMNDAVDRAYNLSVLYIHDIASGAINPPGLWKRQSAGATLANKAQHERLGIKD